jgi:hypothetical protein
MRLQTAVVASKLLEARKPPHGDQATHRIVRSCVSSRIALKSACMRIRSMRRRGHAYVQALRVAANLQSHSEALADLQPQMRIVLSALQVASSSPDGDQETHHTPSV